MLNIAIKQALQYSPVGFKFLLATALLAIQLSAQAQYSYTLYHGSFDVLPDFSQLAPVESNIVETLDLSVSDQADNFAIVFTKTITVETAATFNFTLTSDDGAKLYIDATEVVDHDGLHAAQPKSGSIALDAGMHQLKVEYFERTGEAVLELQYAVQNGIYGPIPNDGVLSTEVPNIADAGRWGPVIAWPHIAVSAANMPDGRVLTWSSNEVNNFVSSNEYSHSSVFDPTSSTFINTDNNFHDMFCAGISTLENGLIVASGGNPDDSRTSAFDPQTLTWSALADMNDRRWYGANITMPDNQVFSSFARAANQRTELYNPEENNWTRTPHAYMQTLVNELNAKVAAGGDVQWWAQLAVTPLGKVFQGGPTPTLHVFDPVGGDNATVLAQPTGERSRTYGNAVSYDVGKVLLIGGSDLSNPEKTLKENVYQVDMNGPTPVITQAAPMHYPRSFNNSVTLPNGEILVVGGNTSGQIFSDIGTVYASEIYNPSTNTWRVVDDIEIPRNYHSTALLLKDGRVLSAGGGNCGGCAANHQDGQVFSPPYLYNRDGSLATRPVLNNVPTQIGAGMSTTVNASENTQQFSMVRLSGTTHHLNTDQRFVPVEAVNNGGGEFTLTFNANPNVLIAGHYWLFAVNDNGTPSIGQTIQVLRALDAFADSDGDGVLNSEDAFPNDPTESVDTDGDGVGDNSDAFPADPTETKDSDGDGIGNNADPTPFGEMTNIYSSRYVRFRALSELNNNNAYASAAEIDLLDGDNQPLNRQSWSVSASSEESNAEDNTAANAIDGDPTTIWHSEWLNNTPLLPHDFVIDMGSAQHIRALRYTPRTDNINGVVKGYEIALSDDGTQWGPALVTGEFTDSLPSTVEFPMQQANLDSDGDGVPDSQDAFPNDPNETHDTDGDGIGDNADPTPNGEAVTALPNAPRNSSTLIVENSSGADRIWNVNPDNNTVSVSNADGALLQTIAVGHQPWALAKRPNASQVFVTNKKDGSISVINTNTLTIEQSIILQTAAQPHGIVFNSAGSEYFVVLEASRVIEKRNASNHQIITSALVSGVPRHLAITYDDSRLLVSNFITPPIQGESTDAVSVENGAAEVFVIDPNDMSFSNTVSISHDSRPLTEFQGPGIPNYLNAPIVSFDNQFAYIPSKKDNVSSGAARGIFGMTFESTVRANSSRITLGDEQEDTTMRVDFDNASVATGAALTGENRYLLVALETSRELAVFDTENNVELMRLPTGRAPQGVALSTDGSKAYVHNFMDRSISRFDLTQMILTALPTSNVLSTINVVSNETLSPQILLGKQLFYDAKDPRLALDSYMSCASCHNDGGQDGRVWDLSAFGEGLRNTIALKGRAAMGHGFLHWSANFDELQDFEKQIRDLAGGSGLMPNPDYFSGTRNTALGDPKTGISSDLDALAAYVASLDRFAPSPYRQSNGDLSPQAAQGKVVFDSLCITCHSGDTFTNSLDANTLQDIGTLNSLSGERLGETLTGIDTPTLRDVWATAPYLHNGSAATVSASIQAHQNLTLSATDLALVTAYTLEIGNESFNTSPSAPTVSITSPNSPANYQVGDLISITADAIDMDGTVVNVKFYVGDLEVGNANNTPFTMQRNDAPVGTYQVFARATDNDGLTTDSTPVTVIVEALNNQAPNITITTPSSPATYQVGDLITITAQATDADGSIDRVDFYVGDLLIGQAFEAPYSMSRDDAPPGTYEVVSHAFDNQGAQSISAPITVIVE